MHEFHINFNDKSFAYSNARLCAVIINVHNGRRVVFFKHDAYAYGHAWDQNFESGRGVRTRAWLYTYIYI